MPAWRFPNFDKFNGFIRDNFQDSEDGIEYYEIKKIAPENLSSSKNILIKFKGSDFTMKNVENLIAENKQLQTQMERAKETIQNLSSEYQKMFTHSNLIKDDEQQKILKRAKKAKRLDEDNKKLRQLLKSQLENSERLRLETQTTIETLKEEFGLLIKELTNLQRRNGEWRIEEGRGSEGSARGPMFGEGKHNDFIPKIDRLEFLLNDQGAKMHGEHDFQKR